MILKNYEVVKYQEDLSNFIEESKDIKIPVKLSYAIMRNYKILTEALEPVQNIRSEIIKRYSDIDEDENKYSVKPECIDVFKKEMEELNNIENDYNLYMLELETIEDYEISLINMIRINFMIS